MENIFYDAISYLKCSPLFNVSLGSKELFHSDFIKWYIESALNNEGKEVFIKKLISEENNKISDIKVEREVKHKDIIINYFDNTEKMIIIENKVKSLPDQQQLTKYEEDYRNKNVSHFILLSLTKPRFDCKPWIFIDYSKLHEIIEDLKQYIKEEKNEEKKENDKILYYKKIVDDYLKLIEHLQVLVSYFPINENDEYTFYSKNEEPYKSLKKLRIHDLYLKFKAAELVRLIKKNLGLNGDLHCSDFNNENGTTTIKFDLEQKKSTIGIQIESFHFRLFIETKENSKNFDLMKKIKEDGLWFFSDEELTDCEILGNQVKGEGRKINGEFPGFNSYKGKGNSGVRFFYKYKEINKDCSVSELIDVVKTYTDRIKKNKDNIIRVMNKK